MRMTTDFEAVCTPKQKSEVEVKISHPGADLNDQCLQRKAAAKREVMLKQRPEYDPPCLVAPGIYLGGVGAARELQRLQDLGVTHVVNASPIVPCFHRKALHYQTVDIYDDGDDDIKEHLQKTSVYISKVIRKGGSVLVHCYAGQSRSSALVMAHLIRTRCISVEDALQCVRAVRQSAEPNAGFIRQLKEFASQFVEASGTSEITSHRMPTA